MTEIEERIIKRTLEGKPFTTKDLEDICYDICDSEHASCSESCPVYRLMTKEQRDSHSCEYFKCGSKILELLKANKGKW